MISLVGGMSFRSVDMPDGEGVTSLGDTVLAMQDVRAATGAGALCRGSPWRASSAVERAVGSGPALGGFLGQLLKRETICRVPGWLAHGPVARADVESTGKGR